MDFTHQCDNKIIAKEKMWLKENEEWYEIHRKNADIDAGSFDDEDLDYRNMMEHMVKQRNKRQSKEKAYRLSWNRCKTPDWRENSTGYVICIPAAECVKE